MGKIRKIIKLLVITFFTNKTTGASTVIIFDLLALFVFDIILYKSQDYHEN